MNTYVDMEYHLTYSNMCGSPPEPAPYCLFSQVQQYLSADKCGQTALLSCRNIGDTTGFCTTDSSYVLDNGLRARPVTLSYSQFLSCYLPQCADYDIPFTLKNTDSICGDVCGYLCARGSKWAMTVEACTVNANITQTSDHICTGQSDTIAVVANCGIPPYHYLWTTNGGSTFDTTYATADYIIGTSPGTDTVIVGCYVVDSCGNRVFAGTAHISVCTSIQSISGNGFNLFPNPAGDMVTIQGEGLNGMVYTSVYDITGRQINTVYQSATGKISIPVDYLSPGMYFVSISTNNQSVVMNFVKQ